MTPVDLELAKAEADVAAAKERLRVLRERIAEATPTRPARPSVLPPSRPANKPVDELALKDAERRLRRGGYEALPGGVDGAA